MITDPRITKLANQIVKKSVSVKAGDHVLIDIHDAPEQMTIALIRAVRAARAYPHIELHNSRISREVISNCSEKQVALHAANSMHKMKKMQCYIVVRGSHNITESVDVPQKDMALFQGKMRPVLNQRVRKTRWCLLRWPTASMAQQAGMSTEAFENFFFRVCLVDYEKKMAAMRALKRLMDKTDRVHLIGPGTDLQFSIKNIPAVICSGSHNIPDGEVFTAPVKDSVEGVISFNTPTIYQSIPFDNICLHFEKGKIFKATSSNSKAMNKIFNTDRGARFIGEFSLGFNPEIHEPMRDILFDEKIAGSFHFTPGQAYEEADNGNRSAIHWDMVNIQRPSYGGGEIYFDGKLIRKDGNFLPKSLKALNSKAK